MTGNDAHYIVKVEAACPMTHREATSPGRKSSTQARISRYRKRWSIRIDYYPSSGAANAIRRRQADTGNALQRVIDDLLVEADRLLSTKRP